MVSSQYLYNSTPTQIKANYPSHKANRLLPQKILISPRNKHFKDVFFRTDSSVTEEKVDHEASGEEYVAMQAKGWKQSPSALESPSPETAECVNLLFVPYCFRANKGGNGQMRVSISNGGTEPGAIFPERF